MHFPYLLNVLPLKYCEYLFNICPDNRAPENICFINFLYKININVIYVIFTIFVANWGFSDTALYCGHKRFRCSRLLLVYKNNIYISIINNLWIYYYFIGKRHWDVYSLVELRKDYKFSKLFLCLKRAPATSGRALLWCGMSWWHGEKGGCISSFSSSNLNNMFGFI